MGDMDERRSSARKDDGRDGPSRAVVAGLVRPIGRIVHLALLLLLVLWLVSTAVVDFDGDPMTSNNVPPVVMVSEVVGQRDNDASHAPDQELPVGATRLTRFFRKVGDWLVAGQGSRHDRVVPIRGP